MPDGTADQVTAALAELRCALEAVAEPESHRLLKSCRHHAADFSWTATRRQAVELIAQLLQERSS